MLTAVVPVPYDWRLSPDMLHRRDGLFATVRASIEGAVAATGMPAVSVCHSLGCLVASEFFDWMQDQPGWQAWMQRHVVGYLALF